MYHWRHLCQMGSRKPEIGRLAAAPGNADIFSFKADLWLLTTLCSTGIATKINLGSVYVQKYIYSPKYKFRKCR